MSTETFLQALREGDLSSVKRQLEENPEYLSGIYKMDESYSGSALHAAAFYNHPEIISFLVQEKEVDVNWQKGIGSEWSPLHHAARMNSREAADALLFLGANPTLKNVSGNTPAEDGNPETRKILKDAISDWNTKKELKNNEALRKLKGDGEWTLNTPQEVIHEYEAPVGKLSLTDTFNFETRIWTSTARDIRSGSISRTIVFFDDMPDKTLLQQALEKAPAGHRIDPASIERRALPGKNSL